MPNQNDQSTNLKEILDRERPRSKWRKWVTIVIVILVLGLAGLWYFRQPSGDAASVGYVTAEVSRSDLEVIVSATGTLEPVNQVDVGSEISGTISSVEADFNDPVKEGQILAVIEPTRLEAQRDQAKAALAVSMANLQNAQAAAAEAKTNLGRLQHAFKASGGKLPSRQELDSAKAAYDKALAQVGVSEAGIGQSEASLKVIESDLAKAVIRSPIDGLVLNRQVEPGQTVAASFQAPILFTLAENLTGMSLSVSVDEADVGQIKEGQNATFVVDAYPDRRFPAEITQVRFAPQVDAGVVTYECILKVDNSDLLLRPGMTATADIVTVEVKDAVLVPNAALRFTPASAAAPAVEQGTPNRSLLSRIVPGPRQRPRAQNKNANADKSPADSKLWVLENGKPVPKSVTLGPSDGINTQIVSGEVEPGLPVIVGQEAAAK